MVWLRKFVAVFAAFAAPALSQDYKMVGSIPIGGAGGWDYLAADSQNRRLYVSHGTEVVVIDLDSAKSWDASRE